MELFSLIEDATAIVRAPKGVLKQTKVYRRGERIFVPHAGGFIRICAKFGDLFSTSHPDIKVEELDVEGVYFYRTEPRVPHSLQVAA